MARSVAAEEVRLEDFEACEDLDGEVVALCRSLDPEARESLVSSLEEYFGDFYDTAAVELGALRYALLSTEEKRAAMAEMSQIGRASCRERV